MKKLLLFLSFAGLTIIANAQWQNTNCPTGMFNGVTEIELSGNNIYAATWGSGVLLSTDYGSTWTAVNNGLSNLNVMAIAIAGNNIFAGTMGGGVFLSSNYGASWTAVNSGLIGLDIYSLFVNGTDIFAGTTHDGVYVSSNNGLSWTSAYSGLPCGVLSFAVNGLGIYAASLCGVYISTNNGANWSAINNGMNTNIYSIAFLGTNIYACSYSSGIFLSNNNGATWTSVNNGLPDGQVHSLYVYGTEIFAGTFHHGVYSSTDSGASWVPANNGLTSVSISSFAVLGNDIYVSIDSMSGVWKRPLSELVGTDEMKYIESNTVIYPNPAKDRLTIESRQKSTIEILNIQGQTILQKLIQQGKTNIDISGLAKGLYILRLSSNDRTEVTKFVKE